MRDLFFGISLCGLAVLTSYNAIEQRRQDQKLHELEHGFNGTAVLHDRVSEIWIEQIRLRRDFDATQRPSGSKVGSQEVPRGNPGQ